MSNKVPVTADWLKQFCDDSGRVSDFGKVVVYSESGRPMRVLWFDEPNNCVWVVNENDTALDDCYPHDLYRQADTPPIPEQIPEGAWIFKAGYELWCWADEDAELNQVGRFWETNGEECNKIPEWLAPELYAWKCPIEDACFQVNRDNSNCHYGKGVKVEPKNLPTAEKAFSELGVTVVDGWLPNPGKMPCDGEMVVDVKFGDGDIGEGFSACSYGWAKLSDSSSEFTITHWKPSGKEWVLHDGKGWPFGERAAVSGEAIQRDGKYSATGHWGPRGYAWTHNNRPEDIIWYRIKPLDAKEEPEEREPLVVYGEGSSDSTGFFVSASRETAEYVHRTNSLTTFREVIPPKTYSLPEFEGVWQAEDSEMPVLVERYQGGLHFKEFGVEGWQPIEILVGDKWRPVKNPWGQE